MSNSFNPQAGYPNNHKIGDYITIVSDNTGGNVAYAATFNVNPKPWAGTKKMSITCEYFHRGGRLRRRRQPTAYVHTHTDGYGYATATPTAHSHTATATATPRPHANAERRTDAESLGLRLRPGLDSSLQTVMLRASHRARTVRHRSQPTAETDVKLIAEGANYQAANSLS